MLENRISNQSIPIPYKLRIDVVMLSLYYGLGVVVALIYNQYASFYQRACACFLLLSFRTFSLSGELSAVTQLSLGLCCSRTRFQIRFQHFKMKASQTARCRVQSIKENTEELIQLKKRYNATEDPIHKTLKRVCFYSGQTLVRFHFFPLSFLCHHLCFCFFFSACFIFSR